MSLVSETGHQKFGWHLIWVVRVVISNTATGRPWLLIKVLLKSDTTRRGLAIEALQWQFNDVHVGLSESVSGNVHFFDSGCPRLDTEYSGGT